TPDEAKHPRKWKQATYALPPDKTEGGEGPASIRTLPAHDKDKDHTYFAAWGRFRSPNDIPVHYLIKAPEKSGRPDTGLRRRYARTDYGLVVEHRWEETLEDVVTLEDMRKARDEWLDLEIRVLEDAFAEAVGAEYDYSAFIKWLK